MRCEIQECGKYQPCRMFIENTLAVEITMGSIKTQAAIFRNTFRVNQHDKVLRKQQSLDLRLKKLFPNEDIIEEWSALHGTDFTFEKHMLVVEVNEKGHNKRPPNYEKKKKKRQNELERLGYYFIRINLDKPGFDDYEEFGRISAYIAESVKIQTEESLVEDLLKKLKELEFKSKPLTKSKYIVKKIFYQIAKNEKHTIKNKANKNWKTTWNNILFGV